MSVKLNGKSNLKNKKNDEKFINNLDNETKMMETELYNWLIMSAYPPVNSNNRMNNLKKKKPTKHKLNK